MSKVYSTRPKAATTATPARDTWVAEDGVVVVVVAGSGLDVVVVGFGLDGFGEAFGATASMGRHGEPSLHTQLEPEISPNSLSGQVTCCPSMVIPPLSPPMVS